MTVTDILRLWMALWAFQYRIAKAEACRCARIIRTMP